MLRLAISMFSRSENCVRTPPAALEVEPLPSCARSISTTSTPASARWKAALVPITPPPTMTTDADSGRGGRRGITRLLRVGAAYCPNMLVSSGVSGPCRASYSLAPAPRVHTP